MKRNSMKKLLSLLLIIAFCTSALFACSGASEEVKPAEKVDETKEVISEPAAETAEAGSLSGKSIEVEVNYTDTNLEGFQKLVDGFKEETGCEVEVITPGKDYEAVMKTRMASGDLPDIFNTHGWSLIRYSEYLMPLNDSEWYDREDPSVFGVMADEDGKIYALCTSQSISGIAYNKTTLDAAGVDATQIRTWEDFAEACQKVKDAGYTAIILGGAEPSNNAGLLGSIAPCFWTDEGAKYNLVADLQGGTFDFSTYGTELYNMINDWVNAGYFNKDLLTLSNDGAVKMLGSGEGAFMLRHMNNISTARVYYPDADLGVIPLPSSTEEGPSAFRIGEGDAFGIWKDTENEAACRAFLDYLARPENVGLMSGVTGAIPAIIDAEISDTYVVDVFRIAQEQFADDLTYDNVFDRKYFPSGMWSIMGDSIGILIANPTDAGVTEAVAYLADGYAEKMAAE